MEPNKLSSEHIENWVLNLTYETSSSEHRFDIKLQARFYEPYQIAKQEEEFMDFNVKQNQEYDQT